MNTASHDSMPGLPLEHRWHQQTQPMPTVVAILRRGALAEARYLLIRRPKDPYQGKWALVGGKWDFGETLPAAILREVQEETALQAEYTALRGVVNERIAPGGPHDEACQFILFVCELSAGDGEATERYEGPVDWFGSELLDEMSTRQEIVPTDYAILKHFTRPGAGFAYIDVDVEGSCSGAGPGGLLRFEVRQG